MSSLIHKPEPSWHVGLVVHLAEILAPNVYVELGIYEGETFNKVNAPKKYAVDISESALNFIPDSKETVKLLGTSLLLNSTLTKSGQKIDFIFIDADHSREGVLEDFRLCEPLMSNYGVIAFHDTFPGSEEFISPKYCGNGYLAIDHLRNDYLNWNFVTLPIHPGLTLASRSRSPEWTL